MNHHASLSKPERAVSPSGERSPLLLIPRSVRRSAREAQVLARCPTLDRDETPRLRRSLCLAAVVGLHGIGLWAALHGNDVPQKPLSVPAANLVMIALPTQRAATIAERSFSSIHVSPLRSVTPVTIPALTMPSAMMEAPLPPSHPVAEQTSPQLPSKVFIAERSAVDDLSALAAWRTRLYQHLERFKRYPGIALARREQGVVYLHFTMDRQGHVFSANVQDSSGHAALDAEALALLRRADPLPAAPAEFQGQHIEVTIPVQFSLSP